ncbi:MAG: acylphosphatase [Eubacterium sp.]|nr:acylphosphatase [Eubacterium sp.]
MQEKIRRHYIFEGRVQGVGFRYRASYAARSLGLSGWVRNCADGTVEMEVQGSEVQVNKMLSFIQQDHYIRIDQLHASNLIIKNNEYGFHVKGY